MNKIITSLKKSFLITVSIHLIAIVVLFIIDAFNYQDFIYLLPITITFLIVPSFLSFYFFLENKTIFTNVFLPFLLNYVIVFLCNYMIQGLYYDFEKLSIFSATNLSVPFISSFVLIFFTLFQNIKLKSRFIVNYNSKELKYSFLKLFVIPVSASIIYTILMIFDHFDLSETIQFLYKFLPIGFILSLVSIHFFDYIFSKYGQSKRVYYILVYYIISISIIVFWIIISNNNFSIVKDGIAAALDRIFIVPYILLYAPFFLYVLIVTHLYFISLISKKEKTVLTQKSLESQLNYQQLKNQLSPHFLFNNINVLTSLIEENPKKAVRFSESLSDIYRYFLEQEQKDVVLVSNEIEFAKNYLALLQSRFEVGFSFTINVDEKTFQKYIVSTVLQQVLENVIKHNSIDQFTPIKVEIYSDEDYIIVKNNKCLKIYQENQSKKGIENLKKRLAFFTDKKVMILDNDFIIKLPILETV